MAKRIRPITIPHGVTVEKSTELIKVKGPLGHLELKFRPSVIVTIDKDKITVSETDPESLVHVGTTRANIQNMMIGVTQGYQKILEVRGVGYRAQKTKDGVQIHVGFIHPVDFPIPPEINVEVKQVPNPDDVKEQMHDITIKGVDKQLVGEITAEIRAIKPPDVYQGKGIRYKGEYVRKKAGKRAVATQT
jgi:large subunit ribosomal protein L6